MIDTQADPGAWAEALSAPCSFRTITEYPEPELGSHGAAGSLPSVAPHSRAPRKDFPIEELRRLLVADPATGRLFWLPRCASDFTANHRTSAEGLASRWNAQYAGKEALTAGSYGYKCGQINGRSFSAHRVIWALTYGYWPETIDHIDGNRMNNCIDNLRDVLEVENAQNQLSHRSGAIPGVQTLGLRGAMRQAFYISST